MLRFILLFILSLEVWGQSQTIDLKKDWIKQSLTNEFTYDSWKNFAPPFGTDQVHEGFKDLFTAEGDSNLCFPASLTTALVKQFAFQQSPLTNLKLAGLSPDKTSIDLNLTIRDLATRCNTDRDEGTYIEDGAVCLETLYRESNLNHEIKLIGSNLYGPLSPGIEMIERRPEINDITNAIDNGYDVLTIISWSVPNKEEKRWKRTGGHFINIFGYARQTPWKDLVVLYISNPYRLYPAKQEIQIFDSVLLQKLSSKESMEISPKISELVFDGMLFDGMKKRGIIQSLMLFKASN